MANSSLIYLLPAMLAGVLMISAAVPSSLAAQSTDPPGEQLEQEVHDLFTRSMDMFLRKDLDGLVNRFLDDGSLKLPGAPLVTGHESLRESYKNTLGMENFDLILQVISVEVSEDGHSAFALTDFTVSFITPRGPFKDSGVSLMVLKRVDNEWKIAAENLSSGPQVIEPRLVRIE